MPHQGLLLKELQWICITGYLRPTPSWSWPVFPALSLSFPHRLAVPAKVICSLFWLLPYYPDLKLPITRTVTFPNPALNTGNCWWTGQFLEWEGQWISKSFKCLAHSYDWLKYSHLITSHSYISVWQVMPIHIKLCQMWHGLDIYYSPYYLLGSGNLATKSWMLLIRICT